MRLDLRALRLALGGVIVMVAGVIGLVVVPANTIPENRVYNLSPGGAPGLSTRTYEVLLIVSWAVLLFGALVVAIGLIDYARSN